MKNSIHQTAIINPKAKLGTNVTIGPYSLINENVEIGNDVNIGGFCELGVETPLSNGSPLIIGNNSTIRSHSIFYESSKFGDNLVTGHHVTIRENLLAGKNLQIGTLSDLQGDSVIGDYVRFHSNVHIGKKSNIGSFVWIYPYVVLTNDPHPPSNILKGVTVGNYSVIATMSIIYPGVIIGENVLVGAHSSLRIDAESGMLYSGNPARKICNASKIKLQDGTKKSAYPWTKHFSRNYPEAIVEKWLENND
jgi:UDP-3-O-[3-hydroxymyristoyl] glucosamine N-acyltransferase